MTVDNPPSAFESNGVLPSASHSDDLDDSMTCSCDKLSICVDCYEGKYSLLMEFNRKKLTELPSSIGEKEQEAESSLLLEQEVSKAFMHDMVPQSHLKDDEQDGQHPTPVTDVSEEVHSEAENPPPLVGECPEAESQSPVEPKEYEISKAECKVEASLAQEFESVSTSQLVHKSSQGIIFDPTLVTFPSSCNLGKKTFHELVQSVILDLFSMLEFNVPLLVVLEPLPTYAKPSFNICIYKEACRPYTLLIENLVEQPVSPLSLLSHEDEHTSSGLFDSCLVTINDACMNSLADDSSTVSMRLDVPSSKHDECDLDDVSPFIYSLSSYNPLHKGCLFNFVDPARLEGVLDLMMAAGL